MFNEIFEYIDDETSREVEVYKQERDSFFKLFNCTERLRDVMQYSKPRSIRHEMTKHMTTQYSRRRVIDVADLKTLKEWCKGKVDPSSSAYQKIVIASDDTIPDNVQRIIQKMQVKELPSIYQIKSKHVLRPSILIYKKGFTGNFCREPNFLANHISLCVDVLLERGGLTTDGLPVIDNTLWDICEGCCVKKSGKEFGSVVAMENDQIAIYMRFTYLVQYEDFFGLTLRNRNIYDTSYHEYVKEMRRLLKDATQNFEIVQSRFMCWLENNPQQLTYHLSMYPAFPFPNSKDVYGNVLPPSTCLTIVSFLRNLNMPTYSNYWNVMIWNSIDLNNIPAPIVEVHKSIALYAKEHNVNLKQMTEIVAFVGLSGSSFVHHRTQTNRVICNIIAMKPCKDHRVYYHNKYFAYEEGSIIMTKENEPFGFTHFESSKPFVVLQFYYTTTN